MNILSMLARLEDALGRNDLAGQMILLPQVRSCHPQPHQPINLVVGYNGSPCSQTALDLTLWIAHQTRLVSRKPVTVQVVYVVDLSAECGQGVSVPRGTLSTVGTAKGAEWQQALNGATTVARNRVGSAIAELPALSTTPQTCRFEQFEQADQILWQARHLAEEWRGSLKTHLRFGTVAQELRSVVEAEFATLLLLGCQSVENPIVQQLGPDFPCPVLGIPHSL